MGKGSRIGWTDHTWNPWQGCHKVSLGCRNCYMYRGQRRYGRDPAAVVRSKTTFYAPLWWKEPARVFVCSWSDFWIEEADNWRREAWAIIRKTPHLTYLIPTKRPERILDLLPPDWWDGWPNVWLGVSAESDRYYHRLDLLQEIPATVRFVSAEPLLAPLDLTPWLRSGGLDWVITGGESPGETGEARPAELAWFRAIRDQCLAAGVAYFHQQHGGYERIDAIWGGRVLDGRTWDEFPAVEVRPVPEQLQLFD